MIGAIAGDIIGSVFEWHPVKVKTFELFHEKSTFTDDTVLTLAIANSLLNSVPYKDSVLQYARKYPSAGYGASFQAWFKAEKQEPYNSWGNGSAMRVSPVGFAFSSLADVLKEAQKSAEITHNHPEGIKGAQAIASAIFLSNTGSSKEEIKTFITNHFGYDLNRTIEAIKPTYQFDVSSQGSVPESIIAFLESTHFEDAVRNAISLGGDADTQACIAGGIAQAFYKKVPTRIIESVQTILPKEEWILLQKFNDKYNIAF